MDACNSLANPFLGISSIPPLGLGLAALGRPGYINLQHSADVGETRVETMQQQCWQVLDAAYAAGVRYFDAARSYGRAEHFLSTWLAARQLPPGAVTVGSKWGYYYCADWQVELQGLPHEVKDHTLPRLLQQQQESLGLLGDHLQLYQIHSATLDSKVLQAPDVLDELARLKRERGLRIGLSLSGVGQADTLRAALQVPGPAGGRLFDSVQATWNLLEQSAGPALQEAADAGMQIIIKEGLANGRLTPRNTMQPDVVACLTMVAEQHGTTVDALALAAIMCQPWKPMVLSGATTVAQLESNARALELAPRLDSGVVADLKQRLNQAPADYWAERAALAWNQRESLP